MTLYRCNERMFEFVFQLDCQLMQKKKKNVNTVWGQLQEEHEKSTYSDVSWLD